MDGLLMNTNTGPASLCSSCFYLTSSRNLCLTLTHISQSGAVVREEAAVLCCSSSALEVEMPLF